MARILLGWELGGGSGHRRKLEEVAAALRARGHEPVLAMSSLLGAPETVPLFQAPLWPSQFSGTARRPTASPATMGDILVHLGLAEEGGLSAVLRGWDAVLSAVRPGAVLAEYAPALVLACRGRYPVGALGTGFSLPPPGLACFPSLSGADPVHDEQRVLARVNSELRKAAREGRARLPQIFEADSYLVSAFREFDPYVDVRREPHGVPSTTLVHPTAEPGDELFAYVSSVAPHPEIWQALAATGMPIRMHDPWRSEAEIAELERWGIAFERKPVPFAKIARRSRMVLSWGSLGFSSAALLAGIPQFVMPSDVEKALVAGALVELGVGRAPASAEMRIGDVVKMIEQAFRDEDLARKARALAPGFQARMTMDVGSEAADLAEALLAG